MRRRRRRWRNRLAIAVPVRCVRFIAERCPAGSRGFQAPDHPKTGSRRGATFATHPPVGRGGQASLRDAYDLRAKPGLESPGYRQGIAPRWAALDFGKEREIAQLRRLWESIELEIIRVLEAGHALKESPDYELHRLTAQTPAFFDETVKRHVESLEKELATLEAEAEELAQEIEELTGEAVPGIG